MNMIESHDLPVTSQRGKQVQWLVNSRLPFLSWEGLGSHAERGAQASPKSSCLWKTPDGGS